MKQLMNENELSKIVVESCLKIHRRLGPGLLESVYEEVLCHELTKADVGFKRQQGIVVIYEEIKMDLGFRADLIIENKLIVELKSVESIAPVHAKVLLTYLRLSNIKLGLLINFKRGINKGWNQKNRQQPLASTLKILRPYLTHSPCDLSLRPYFASLAPLRAKKIKLP